MKLWHCETKESQAENEIVTLWNQKEPIRKWNCDTHVENEKPSRKWNCDTVKSKKAKQKINDYIEL
jgi:hypothetical protein